MLESKTPGSAALSKGRVLLIEDDATVRKLYHHALTLAGFDVRESPDAARLTELLDDPDLDLILSDIALPGIDGLQVLAAARRRDPDLPVILVTGGAQLETAIQAVELGALRYLLKPVAIPKLVAFVEGAVRLRRIAKVKRRAYELYGHAAHEDSDLRDRFQHALESLSLVHQPIVRWSTRSIFAYEALVRTGEGSLHLPEELLAAATALVRLPEVGRGVRRTAAREIETGAPTLFVNLHTDDLHDEELFAPDSPLSRLAHRVVLELTERASLDAVEGVPERLRALRSLGYRFAIDDLGAGYSGLSTFARLEPEFVKLDLSLTHGVESEPTKRKLVATMTGLCRELGIEVIAEGIETPEQLRALVDAGCDLFQGFLFARPGEGFPGVPLELDEEGSRASGGMS